MARQVWIVMKNLLPELPSEVKPFVIECAEMDLSSLHEGLTAETCWFIEQGADRSKLGTGVLVHTVAVGSTASARMKLVT